MFYSNSYTYSVAQKNRYSPAAQPKASGVGFSNYNKRRGKGKKKSKTNRARLVVQEEGEKENADG